MNKEKSKWYVYELIDPRTNTVFYIGKGAGDRMNHHEREAKNKTGSEKQKRINAIWESSLEVQKNKVALFWDEQAAYQCEAGRIRSTKNLTNISLSFPRKPRARTISFLKTVFKIVTKGSSEELIKDLMIFKDRLPMKDHEKLFNLALKAK